MKNEEGVNLEARLEFRKLKLKLVQQIEELVMKWRPWKLMSYTLFEYQWQIITQEWRDWLPSTPIFPKLHTTRDSHLYFVCRFRPLKIDFFIYLYFLKIMLK